MPLYTLSFSLFPFIIYACGIIILVTGILALSYFLGERHHQPATDDPYESGILPTSSAHLRFTPHFFLMAMLFVIFDLEAVFIISWAISFWELGLTGYIGAGIFIIIQGIIILYLWKSGAFDFGTSGKKILNELQKASEKQEL